jgi:hypothetical protein
MRASIERATRHAMKAIAPATSGALRLAAPRNQRECTRIAPSP